VSDSPKQQGEGRTVLHLAPHPDDEMIGAPATLMALRDAGWRVVNLACGLGGATDASRRRRREQELRESCRRAGFELLIADVSSGPGSGPGAGSGSQQQLAAAVDQAMEELEPSVVVAPSPHDGHPRHEAVGRAAVAACEGALGAPRLWLWGLWSDLAFATLAVGFDEKRLKEVLGCLGAHEGELTRNDYRRLVHGRAEMNASLGPERVFGFGSRAVLPPGSEYVELLCEVLQKEGTWRLGSSRWLDPDDPLGTGSSPSQDQSFVQAGSAKVPDTPDIGKWLREPSVSTRYRS
jgi:LmbE family N-acetylglucosaminyl deacetylase